MYHHLLQSEVESGLPAVWEEEEVGEGVVLKVFQLRGGKAATVGGCRVKRGRFCRSATFRLFREGEVRLGGVQGKGSGVHSDLLLYRLCMKAALLG